MGKKLMSWKTKGMNRDLSVSAFNPEFAFENMNLRLSTNEGNTLMSWVNEKGTKLITPTTYEYWYNNQEPTTKFSFIDPNDTYGWSKGEGSISLIIDGIPIGTAVINHQLILFTTGGTGWFAESDYIYLFEYDNEGHLVGNILYK